MTEIGAKPEVQNFSLNFLNVLKVAVPKLDSGRGFSTQGDFPGFHLGRQFFIDAALMAASPRPPYFLLVNQYPLTPAPKKRVRSFHNYPLFTSNYT